MIVCWGALAQPIRAAGPGCAFNALRTVPRAAHAPLAHHLLWSEPLPFITYLPLTAEAQGRCAGARASSARFNPPSSHNVDGLSSKNHCVEGFSVQPKSRVWPDPPKHSRDPYVSHRIRRFHDGLTSKPQRRLFPSSCRIVHHAAGAALASD